MAPDYERVNALHANQTDQPAVSRPTRRSGVRRPGSRVGGSMRPYEAGAIVISPNAIVGRLRIPGHSTTYPSPRQ